MSSSCKHFFTDPAQTPTPAVILSALGPASAAWSELFEAVRARHPDLIETWNYYRDGKSWLLKVTRKSQTMFWVAVEKGAFRVTFYFPERLVAAVLESEISDRLKASIRLGKPMGKLRGVSVAFGGRKGVSDVMALISLKKTVR